MENIQSVVCLRAKLYSIQTRSKKHTTAAKGISKRHQTKLKHQDFVEVLQNNQQLYVSYQQIMSKKHLVKTMALTKKALSATDVKRFYLNCGIHSKPYGSNEIQEDGTCPRCAL